MPPLPTIPGVVRYKHNYVNEDASAYMIRYFSYTGSGAIDSGELEAFLDETVMNVDIFAPFVGASIGSEHGALTTLEDLSSDTGAEYSMTQDWTGTNTGTALPASAAVCVSEEITRRYRGGHPRTYMMVGSASDYATSSIKMWQAAFLSNIQAGWDAWMADFPFTVGSRTWNPVNVSYWETVAGERVLRATPQVDLITSMIARDRVCSQRRRLGKIGG